MGSSQQPLPTRIRGSRWLARKASGVAAYIAYLVLFVIAAGTEDDFPPHAYYPRLRKVLGKEPEPRALASFDKMLALWDDLERWSNVDEEGNRGVFEARLLGSLIPWVCRAGRHYFQRKSCTSFPLIFPRAGLDPTAVPSDREISRILVREGRALLRNGTLQTLKSRAESDAEIRQALIEVILEELREWSGETFETGGEAGEGVRYQTGTLRLCCDLDRSRPCADDLPWKNPWRVSRGGFGAPRSGCTT